MNIVSFVCELSPDSLTQSSLLWLSVELLFSGGWEKDSLLEVSGLSLGLSQLPQFIFYRLRTESLSHREV